MSSETLLWPQILSWARTINSMEIAWTLRRQFNGHHSKKDVNYERQKFDEEQRRLFFILKQYYVENRKALVKELETLDCTNCEHAQGIIDSLERCLSDDVEQTLLANGEGD